MKQDKRMTKEEAISTVESGREQYISRLISAGFSSEFAAEQYDSLVNLVRTGKIMPNALHKYMI